MAQYNCRNRYLSYYSMIHIPQIRPRIFFLPSWATKLTSERDLLKVSSIENTWPIGLQLRNTNGGFTRQACVLVVYKCFGPKIVPIQLYLRLASLIGLMSSQAKQKSKLLI
uniref:Uncharacterized protein n=1 Tax=Arundo donax TaxID=35708 RepID=A0A0A8ZPY0_ARUDO